MSGGEKDIAEAVEGATVLAFPSPDGRAPPARMSEDAKNAEGPALGGQGGGGPPEGSAPGAAADDGGDDGLELLNRNYALVIMGSRAVVMRESDHGPIEDRLKFISIEALKAYFANRTVKRVKKTWDAEREKWIKTTSYPKIAPLWLASKARRTFDGVEFFPDPGDAPGTPHYFNLWRGFSVTPDESPPELRRKKYTVFRDHLLTNVCDGNREHFDWLFAWMAHMVQRPRERIGTAVVLRGRMGVGKTVLGHVLGSLFQAHYFLVDDPRYLVGQFNAHMASCLLLQVDEGFWAGDKAAEGRLKGLITADKQMIEAKGVDPIRLDNYVRLMFSSNEGWVVPAGMDERRFAVFDVADHAKENHGYFAELYREMDNGGRGALLADLLAVDLERAGAPNVRVIPKTEALLEQKIRSLAPIEQWLFSRLTDGAQTHRKSKWEHIVAIRTIYSDFLRWADRVGIRRKPSDIEFGIGLKKLLAMLGETRRNVEVEEIGDDGRPVTTFRRVRCYEFPTLAECREAFASALRQPVDWGAPIEPGESDVNREKAADVAPG